jgi:hypothetical protein
MLYQLTFLTTDWHQVSPDHYSITIDHSIMPFNGSTLLFIQVNDSNGDIIAWRPQSTTPAQYHFFPTRPWPVERSFPGTLAALPPWGVRSFNSQRRIGSSTPMITH